MTLAACKQSFRRNAAAIKTNAAGIGFEVNERGFNSKIGGQKRGGITAGAAADNY